MAGQSRDDDGPITGINVTPLVDVMLVLLVIFIVTAKIVVTPAVPLDLPSAATGKETQVVLAVTVPYAAKTLVNGISVSDDASFTRLARAAHRRTPALRAVVSVDGRVPHRRVLHVLDLLRQVRITRVAFGTKEGRAKP